jgi:hypothetical protein
MTIEITREVIDRCRRLYEVADLLHKENPFGILRVNPIAYALDKAGYGLAFVGPTHYVLMAKDESLHGGLLGLTPKRLSEWFIRFVKDESVEPMSFEMRMR